MPHFPSFFKKKLPESQATTATSTDPRTKLSNNSYSVTEDGRASMWSDPATLADGFGRLSLNSGQSHRHRHEAGRRPPPSGEFVGGFAPRGPTRHDATEWEAIPPAAPPRHAYHGEVNGTMPVFPEAQRYFPTLPGPLPTPPQMPMPEPQMMSRTMAHALAGEALPPPPPKQDLRPPVARPMGRPHSDLGPSSPSNRLQVPPPKTPQRPHLQTAPNSAPAKPASSSSSRPAPTVQTPPGRPRAASSPPSPISVSSSGDKGVRKVQCCAITKQDKRCTRKIPVTTPLALLNGEEEPQYCHQHMKNAFVDLKFPSRKDPSIKVSYEDWVPEYLQESTRTLLRDVMQREASAADEPGYIYAYEIEDDSHPDVVHIKVGRAVKLTKRLAEWDKQCQSKQTHLRGFWPMSRDAELNGMMRSRVQVGDPGPYCHRVERLVHIELADLALNAPYLDPDFPNVKGFEAGSGNRRAALRGPCPDCGTVHKEIFTFRCAKGRYKGKEWEEIVRPVIEKWGGFVEAYV